MLAQMSSDRLAVWFTKMLQCVNHPKSEFVDYKNLTVNEGSLGCRFRMAGTLSEFLTDQRWSTRYSERKLTKARVDRLVTVSLT